MDLIAALSASTTLENLRPEFPRDIDEGLDLPAFVRLLKRQLAGFIKDELSFGVQAVELFKLMDVRGDGETSWRDFTDYILQLDLLTEAGQNKLQQKAAYHLVPTKREDVDFASNISQMSYFPQPIGKVALTQQDSDVVHLMTRPLSLTDRPRSVMVLRHLTAYKAHQVLSCACLAGQDTVVCSSISEHGSACFITFWDLPTEQERTSGEQYLPVLAKRIETTLPMACLFYSPRLEMILAGTEGSGVLMGYDVKSYESKVKLRIHNSKITGIIEINGSSSKGNSFIVTGSDDGNLCVLTIKKKQMKEMICIDSRDSVSWIGAHDNGVLILRHARQHGLVITAGVMIHYSKASPGVMVWAVDSNQGLARTEVKSINHHHHQVCGIEVVDHLEHFITADESGQIFVWDLNTLNLLQIFNEENMLPKSLSDVTTICSLPQEKGRPDALPLLLVANKNEIRAFRWQTQRITDPLIQVLYNERFRAIVTVSAVQLVVWSADTGRFLRLHTAEELTGEPKRDLTACCLDNKGRKIIVGDDSGCVNVVDFTNGRHIKQLDRHRQMVTWVHYPFPDTDACVLSSSVDGTLQVSDESDALGYHEADPKKNIDARSIILKQIRFEADHNSSGQNDQAEDSNVASIPRLSKSRHSLRSGNVVKLKAALEFASLTRKLPHGSAYGSEDSRTEPGEIAPIDISVSYHTVNQAAESKASHSKLDSNGHRPSAHSPNSHHDSLSSTSIASQKRAHSFLSQFGSSFEILTCAVDVGLGLFATVAQAGSSDQFVNVWDYEMCSMRGACVIPQYRNLPELLPTALTFLAPHRLLAGTTLTGALYLWRVPTCEAILAVLLPSARQPGALTTVCYGNTTPPDRGGSTQQEMSEQDDVQNVNANPSVIVKAEPPSPKKEMEGPSYAEEHHHLICGDDRGNVLFYRFGESQLAQFIGPDSKEEDRPAHNPYRMVKIRVGSERMKYLKKTANYHQKKFKCREKEFTLFWSAHEDQITAMQLIKGSSILITSSADSTAKVWNIEGMELLGTLDVNSPVPKSGGWKLGKILSLPEGTNGSQGADMANVAGILSNTRKGKEGRNSASAKSKGKRDSTALEELRSHERKLSVLDRCSPNSDDRKTPALTSRSSTTTDKGGLSGIAEEAEKLQWGDMMQQLQDFKDTKEEKNDLLSEGLAELRSKEPSMGTKWKVTKEPLGLNRSGSCTLHTTNHAALRSQMLQQIAKPPKPRSVDFDPTLKKKYQRALAQIDEKLFSLQQNAKLHLDSQHLGHTNSLLVSGKLKREQKQKKVSAAASIKYNLSNSVPELMTVNISAGETRMKTKQLMPEKSSRCIQTSTINKLAHMGLL